MQQRLPTYDLWSHCCGAKVIDPGNTWEWLCTSCKEHCMTATKQEVDVVVLNYLDDKHRVHLHRILYDNTNTDYNTLEEYVKWFLSEIYGSTNNLERMCDEEEAIKINDHRETVESSD